MVEELEGLGSMKCSFFGGNEVLIFYYAGGRVEEAKSWSVSH